MKQTATAANLGKANLQMSRLRLATRILEGLMKEKADLTPEAK